MKSFAFAATAALVALSTVADSPPALTPLGTLKTGPLRGEDPRIAEINAYDSAGRRIYVVNPLNGRLDVIDASDPAAPLAGVSLDLVSECQSTLGTECPLLAGGEPNSVAIQDRLLVVAVANAVRTANGHAVFFKLRGADKPLFLEAVEVGALPDMVTFSPDGRYVLTANEGEPNPDYTIDPPGSVTIIEVAGVGNRKTVRHVGFQAFDTTEERERLQQDGVRIFGPGATVSQDLEPEYISIAGNTAYVTLQENNALAIINIEKATVERIVGLGLKDHSLVGNALDTSDQDGGINIRNWPIYGLYEPDAIHAFNERGQTYLIMANEGDAREYAGYAEAVRLNNTGYLLDPIAFPTRASTLTATATSIASKNGRPCGVRTARASRQCP